MGQIKINNLKKTFKKFNYKWYDDEPNFIGIRTKLDIPNSFNDLFIAVFPWKGKEIMKQWVITTDPGIDYLSNPLNTKGCAILVPNQYIDTYSIGYHHGDKNHKALCQKGKVKVYRDNNRDEYIDLENPQDKGLFGINIHRASKWGTTKNIGKFSAGCQVFQNINDHKQLIWIADQFKEKCNNKFTYTLLREQDIII